MNPQNWWNYLWWFGVFAGAILILGTAVRNRRKPEDDLSKARNRKGKK